MEEQAIQYLEEILKHYWKYNVRLVSNFLEHKYLKNVSYYIDFYLRTLNENEVEEEQTRGIQNSRKNVVSVPVKHDFLFFQQMVLLSKLGSLEVVLAEEEYLEKKGSV